MWSEISHYFSNGVKSETANVWAIILPSIQTIFVIATFFVARKYTSETTILRKLAQEQAKGTIDQLNASHEQAKALTEQVNLTREQFEVLKEERNAAFQPFFTFEYVESEPSSESPSTWKVKLSNRGASVHAVTFVSNQQLSIQLEGEFAEYFPSQSSTLLHFESSEGPAMPDEFQMSIYFLTLRDLHDVKSYNLRAWRFHSAKVDEDFQFNPLYLLLQNRPKEPTRVIETIEFGTGKKGKIEVY